MRRPALLLGLGLLAVAVGRASAGWELQCAGERARCAARRARGGGPARGWTGVPGGRGGRGRASCSVLEAPSGRLRRAAAPGNLSRAARGPGPSRRAVGRARRPPRWLRSRRVRHAAGHSGAAAVPATRRGRRGGSAPAARRPPPPTCRPPAARPPPAPLPPAPALGDAVVAYSPLYGRANMSDSAWHDDTRAFQAYGPITAMEVYHSGDGWHDPYIGWGGVKRRGVGQVLSSRKRAGMQLKGAVAGAQVQAGAPQVLLSGAPR
jgi:hypothetical protein